ncbi:hypothetical protein [Arthrobacter roseus]|uniref:hypothetical protein n=1 Tax=Arthrobacter roseus TaxID=136274 RepID=UPI001964B0B8|nr:hypothetical protein [Arthrobacter roseus]MBM7847119.1 hypothetical protein [Arthrobacter roseus]
MNPDSAEQPPPNEQRATLTQGNHPPIPENPPETGTAPPSRTLLSGIGSARWLAAGLSAAVAYGATLVGAVITLVLVFIGTLLTSNSGMDSTVQEYSGIDPAEIAGGFLFIIGIPFQLTGMAFMGAFGAELGTNFFGAPLELGGMLWVLPLFLTGLAVAALWWLGRRTERKQPTTPAQAWILSGTTGLALALIAMLLGLVFTIRSGDAEMAVSINSVSVSLFFGALAIGTLASRAGRAAARGFVLARKYPSVMSALKVFGLHFLAYTVVAGVIVFIAAIVKGGALAAFSAPLWLPTAATWVYGVGHFTTLGASTSAASDSMNVFDLPWWATLLLVLFTLALAVLASVVWALVRNNDPAALRRGTSWVVLPTVFLIGGLTMSVASAAVFDVSGGIFALSGTMALAPWTFLIMGLWGGAIEASSRFVAPVLIPLVPARVWAWLTHQVSQPTTVPGTHIAGAGGPAAAAVASDGAPSSAPTGDGAGQVTEPQPMSAQAKKRLRMGAIIAGAVVVLSVGATVAYNVVSTNVFGPQAQVEKYLDSLRDGDAATAVDILDPNVTSEERVLLTNQIFSAAENRISGYEIRDVETTDDGAVITADLTQDSKTTPITFVLEKGDRTAVVFNEWRVVSGGTWLLPIQLPEGANAIKVNGVDVELPSMEGQQAPGAILPVLPGSYVITPPEGTKYVTLGEAKTVNVAVDPASNDLMGAQFEISLTDAVQKDAVAQAKAYLEKCLASKEAEPESCPNNMYTSGDAEDYRNISWSVETEPTYEVSDGYQGESVRLSASDGEATVTYERNTEWDDDEPAVWEKNEDSQGLYFSGEVLIEKDKLSVTFTD